jgi:hypothetical protein
MWSKPDSSWMTLSFNKYVKNVLLFVSVFCVYSTGSAEQCLFGDNKFGCCCEVYGIILKPYFRKSSYYCCLLGPSRRSCTVLHLAFLPNWQDRHIRCNKNKAFRIGEHSKPMLLKSWNKQYWNIAALERYRLILS